MPALGASADDTAELWLVSRSHSSLQHTTQQDPKLGDKRGCKKRTTYRKHNMSHKRNWMKLVECEARCNIETAKLERSADHRGHYALVRALVAGLERIIESTRRGFKRRTKADHRDVMRCVNQPYNLPVQLINIALMLHPFALAAVALPAKFLVTGLG